MIREISRILSRFRPCFSRQAAFDWFVITVLGFIIRIDHCGVSSFVRWLGINRLCTRRCFHFSEHHPGNSKISNIAGGKPFWSSVPCPPLTVVFFLPATESKSARKPKGCRR